MSQDIPDGRASSMLGRVSAELVITAITKQGLSQAEAARTYGLSQAWVSRLMARYRLEGEAAFEPRSRRPNTRRQRCRARSWISSCGCARS